MRFMFHNNLLSEEWLARVRLTATKYPSVLVDMIPMDSSLITEDPLEGNNYIPYGSTNMLDICRARGDIGVAFDVEKFSYAEYAKNTKVLNQGTPYKLHDAIQFFKENEGMWFAKPNKDDKKFTGIVKHSSYFETMLSDMYLHREAAGNYGVDEDFEVIISKPLDIQMEVRWFVIGGKVIDGSMYRAHDQLRKENVTNEPGMLAEAQAFADIWLPHENVAMDLALVDGELSVIEFNCINSAGFYDNNYELIFEKLWNHYYTVCDKNRDSTTITKKTRSCGKNCHTTYDEEVTTSYRNNEEEGYESRTTSGIP